MYLNVVPHKMFKFLHIASCAVAQAVALVIHAVDVEAFRVESPRKVLVSAAVFTYTRSNTEQPTEALIYREL